MNFIKILKKVKLLTLTYYNKSSECMDFFELLFNKNFLFAN